MLGDTALPTLHIHINAQQPEWESVLMAAQLLKEGRLVAFPTETVYGLGANALSSQAVNRIFAAKERPATDPLIVHISQREHLTRVAWEVPPLAWALAEAFWPGPLTLILPKHPAIPLNVTAGQMTVAVRMPAHPVAWALIEAAGVPIAAPSANRFSRPSPTQGQHVLDDLAGRIDVLLDAGATPIGLESTILDLSSDPPAVLRPGGLPIEALRAHLPTLVLRRAYISDEVAAPAPGMLLKHYAPQSEFIVYQAANPTLAWGALRAEALQRTAAGQRIGLLLRSDEAHWAQGLGANIADLGADEATMAARFFAALRQLEGECDVIFAVAPAPSGLGLALWDRMVRAAEGRMIQVQ